MILGTVVVYCCSELTVVEVVSIDFVIIEGSFSVGLVMIKASVMETDERSTSIVFGIADGVTVAFTVAFTITAKGT